MRRLTVRAAVTVRRVFGRVSRVGRVGILDDLVREFRGAAVGVAGCVRGELRPVDGDQFRAQDAGSRTAGQHLTEQPRDRILVLRAEARDGGVIWLLAQIFHRFVGADHLGAVAAELG
jgi:hypothetical protein